VRECGIRRAVPADASSLAALAAETFPLACPPTLSESDIQAFIELKLSVDAFQRYLADPDYRLWVAVPAPEPGADQEPAGYAMAIHGEPDDPETALAVVHRPTVELSKIYLRNRYHGSGTAARLMQAAIDDAREAGAASVWLGVNKLNDRANRFYAAQGFVVVGERRFRVGDQVEVDFVRERAL
jgi:ribosomal protein S18 acetylase RimI-like enzyme